MRREPPDRERRPVGPRLPIVLLALLGAATLARPAGAGTDAAPAPPEVWRLVATGSAPQGPSSSLSYEPERLRALRVGDRVALPIPGGPPLPAVVERVVRAARDRLAVFARVDTATEPYAAVWTLGPGGLSASVGTPRGAYRIATRDGRAAIHLDPLAELSDPPVGDVRLPREPAGILALRRRPCVTRSAEHPGRSDTRIAGSPPPAARARPAP